MIEHLYKRQAEEDIRYTEAFLSASFRTQKFQDDGILNAIATGLTVEEVKYGCRIKVGEG